MTGKSHVESLVISFLVFAMELLGCELRYDPIIANAYDVPCLITTIFKDGHRESVMIPAKGELVLQGKVFSTFDDQTFSIRTLRGQAIEEIVVSLSTGEVLSRYRGSKADSAGWIHSGAMGSESRWLLAPNGIFAIVDDLWPNWQSHIPEIEKSSPQKIPRTPQEK